MVGEALGENFVNLKKKVEENVQQKEDLQAQLCSFFYLSREIFFNVVLQAIQINVHRVHLHNYAGCYVGHGQVAERASGRPGQEEAVQTTRDVRGEVKTRPALRQKFKSLNYLEVFYKI